MVVDKLEKNMHKNLKPVLLLLLPLSVFIYILVHIEVYNLHNQQMFFKNAALLVENEDKFNYLLREIFEIKLLKIQVENFIKKTINQIVTRKDNQNYLTYEYYKELSSAIPSSLNITKFPNKTLLFEEINQLRSMEGKIPYLNRKLNIYKPEDVNICIKNRQKKGKSFDIAYFGDSRIRRNLETFVDFLSVFNFTITVLKDHKIPLHEFQYDRKLWKKYKRRLTAISHNNDLKFRFYWSPKLNRAEMRHDYSKHNDYLKNNIFNGIYLDNIPENILKTSVSSETGPVDELKLLLKSNNIPDLVILNFGMWAQDIKNGPLYRLDRWAVTAPLDIFDLLEKLAEKTQVIFALPNPLKKYPFTKFVAKTEFMTDKETHFYGDVSITLQWLLNSQVALLPKNLILWDSMIPFAFTEIRDCLELIANKKKWLRKQLTESIINKKGCYDPAHYSDRVHEVGVQMILNLLCDET